MPDYTMVESIFLKAVEQESPAELSAFLDANCPDAEIRREVERLLAADPKIGEFLSAPAMAADATVEHAAREGPGSQIGPYRLMEKIGEGGFGLVFIAEQHHPVRRKVAVKVIKPGMDSRDVIARFEAERQALALMDHPNIAKVLDAGTTDSGYPYFVMELVKGIPIIEYCDQQKLNTTQRLELFVSVCRAVKHAHSKGVIHRDLKPSNIMVAPHDGVPVIKVIDFGVAKAIGQQLTDKTVYTRFSQMIGTPLYMSPEQAEINALDVDTRSDVYSLGVLLYELLTGTTPFDRERLAAAAYDEMRRIIREEEPPKPSTRVSSMGATPNTVLLNHGLEPVKLSRLIRGDLDWIVMKAMEKDRSRRYETVNELADDVQRFARNEPIAARPPSMIYRAEKVWKRNKVVLTAVAVVVVSLVVATTASTLAYIRAKDAYWKEKLARDEADKQRIEAIRSQEETETARLQSDQHLYAANMNLIQQAWEANNLERLRHLLRETESYAHRGFEWYYWQRLANQDARTLWGHTHHVVGVAFSPDGQRIVTGSWDNTAIVWDANNGRRLGILEGHDYWIHSVAFSADGNRIVTGSWDHTAKIWDARTYKEIVLLTGHANAIKLATFSSDGTRVITGGFGPEPVRIWDASTGDEKDVLPVKGEALAFSPDGSTLVLIESTATEASVWNYNHSTREFQEGFKLRHAEDVRAAAFSQDGQRIFTVSDDHVGKLWDARNGTELSPLTLEGHSSAMRVATFSPDGKRIAVGSEDGTASVWELATGTHMQTLRGHDRLRWGVAGIAFSDRQIATAGQDHTVKLWDAEQDFRPPTLEGHNAEVLAVNFSPDGRSVVTGGADHLACMWDVDSPSQMPRLLSGHGSWVGTATFSWDGTRIVTTSWDQTAKVWDAVDRRVLASFEDHGWISSAAFSPNGKHIVSGCGDGSATVWDSNSGRLIHKLADGHRYGIFCVAYSHDGRHIVTGGGDATAVIWDAISGKLVRRFSGHNKPIRSIAFISGELFATASDDLTVKIWDTSTEEPTMTLLGHTAPVNSIAITPTNLRKINGSDVRIVSGSDDGTVKVWDANGLELLTLPGHQEAVTSVACSPDGLLIASCGKDKTVKLWTAASVEQVDKWKQRQTLGAQILELMRQKQQTKAERERTIRRDDVGAIKRWLLLAPIVVEVPTDRSDQRKYEHSISVFAQHEIPNESMLEPTVGRQQPLAHGTQLPWRQIEIEDDYIIDFNLRVGKTADWSVAYAVTYVECESRKEQVRLFIGSDDQSKLYLNGELVYSRETPRSFVPDQDEKVVTLKRGRNVLVFKVMNKDGGWQGSVRLADADGEPLDDIKVSLHPTNR